MIYQRKSRMPVQAQQKLLEHVVAGTTARAAALLVEVQANTAKLFYERLRQLNASCKLPCQRDLVKGEVLTARWAPLDKPAECRPACHGAVPRCNSAPTPISRT